MTDVDTLLFNIAALVAGLLVLERGADTFLDHTAVVARRLNVSPTLVALLTCGAEWEELVVIAVSIAQGKPTLALGNLLGSSVANILASFSLGLLVSGAGTVVFDRSAKIYAAVLLAVTTLFLIFLTTLTSWWVWLAGALLVVAFVAYVASVAWLIYRGTLDAPEDSDPDSDSDSSSDSDSDSDSDSHSDSDADPGPDEGSDHDTLAASSDDDIELAKMHKKHRQAPPINMAQIIPTLALPAGDEDDDQETRLMHGHTAMTKKHLRVSRSRSPLPAPQKLAQRPKPLRAHVTKLLLGLGALMLASYVVAHSAATVGSQLGMTGTVVGTTILSFATTLPEKFVAVMVGLRRQPGVLVANTVGSNIFLATLCAGVLFLGATGTGAGVADISGAFSVSEVLFVWCSAAAVLVIVLVGGRRWMGALCLSVYVGYITTEVVCGRNAVAGRE